MTMMKLRLNLATTDLAYRFTVSRTTACKYIDKFITVIAVRLPPALLRWPNKEASEFTMPRVYMVRFRYEPYRKKNEPSNLVPIRNRTDQEPLRTVPSANRPKPVKRKQIL